MTGRATEPGGPPPTEPPAAPRRGGFPAPLTILLGMLLLVWLAAFLIPSGAYLTDATG